MVIRHKTTVSQLFKWGDWDAICNRGTERGSAILFEDTKLHLNFALCKLQKTSELLVEDNWE
jgi:hypothetical protein